MQCILAEANNTIITLYLNGENTVWYIQYKPSQSQSAPLVSAAARWAIEVDYTTTQVYHGGGREEKNNSVVILTAVDFYQENMASDGLWVRMNENVDNMAYL